MMCATKNRATIADVSVCGFYQGPFAPLLKRMGLTPEENGAGKGQHHFDALIGPSRPKKVWVSRS
jgi:hypothetical protein